MTIPTEKLRIDFPPIVNAAWHVLSSFVNPSDCASKFSFLGDDGKSQSLIVPMNTNAAMEAFLTGEVIDGQKAGLHWFTKGRLQSHLTGIETFYYRSRPNGRARLGYGGYAGATDRIGFDHRELHVTSPVRRFEHVGVLLLCADIDAHHGETDAPAVRDWLLNGFFPEAYWEPSTSGRGIHLYLKVAYSPWQCGRLHTTIVRVCQVIREFARSLDAQRIAMGFNAKVDGLLGLPSLIDFTNERLRIHRSRCVKLPRFAGGMPDIQRFHFSPYFLLNGFEAGTPQMASVNQQEGPECPCGWDRLSEEFLMHDIENITGPRPPKSSSHTSSGGDVILNSVYPRDQFEDMLRDLRKVEDAFERSLSFVQIYSRRMGRVPTAAEAMAAYEQAHLNTGIDEEGRRQARFQYIASFVAKTFRKSRGDWLPDTYEKVRQTVEAEVTIRLQHQPQAGVYLKAKGRSCRVAVETLSAGWFAMWHSQGANKDTAFSYQQMGMALKRLTGRTPCRAELSACFSALKALRAITFIRGAVPGIRGVRYEVTGW